MKVIGLAGPSGVGKSTIAALYFRPLGYFDVALADAIKIRAVATGVASFEEVFTSAKSPRVRTWLQEEGTDRGRKAFGDDVWVRSLFTNLRRMESEWGLDQFVITDVRFRNEIEYIHNAGGLVLRVEAPSRQSNNQMTHTQRLHTSEHGLDECGAADFDGVLLNDPTYTDTLAWQVHAHLYMAQLTKLSRRRGISAQAFPSSAGLSTAQKCQILRRMFPHYDWYD